MSGHLTDASFTQQPLNRQRLTLWHKKNRFILIYSCLAQKYYCHTLGKGENMTSWCRLFLSLFLSLWARLIESFVSCHIGADKMCKAQICVTILMACEHVSVSAIERETERVCACACLVSAGLLYWYAGHTAAVLADWNEEALARRTGMRCFNEIVVSLAAMQRSTECDLRLYLLVYARPCTC